MSIFLRNLLYIISLYRKEMRYSTYNTIPQYPKSKKRPYEALEKQGIPGKFDARAVVWDELVRLMLFR